jgi:SOS-response transcriptional repressor LexA
MFSGKKEQSLGDVIREAFKDSGIDQKLQETRILENLNKILGSHISHHIQSKRISKSILYIRLDSAALRHELGYRRDELKKALNDSVGQDLLKEIVLS